MRCLRMWGKLDAPLERGVSDDGPASLLLGSLTWFSSSLPPGDLLAGGDFISILNLKKSSVNEEV